MNPLLQLIEHGQSYWLDNLTRRMMKSGELKRRVTEQGLRGVTSNPAIFHKAISGSDDYDSQIGELVGEGLQVYEIYEQLVVTDIREACDILRPVYDASDGVDGFVSLEVSPYLAHDTEGTISEARHLFKAVSRPNVLIKIPGTPGGIPAIEQVLYEGINVNVTLLFSIQSYEAVAEAFVKALERRAVEGKSLKDVASVASFFLSRIDVLADQLLSHRISSRTSVGEEPRPEQLLGKLAIASAKLAFQSYKRIFGGDRWKGLEKKRARVQRLLWASTSTKNPLYRDVYYVEPLIGPDTVNTMPNETIDAFADHGVIVKNSVELDVEGSQEVFADLRKVRVSPEFVTEQLLNEGVQKFIDPFDELLTKLAEKREQSLGEKFNYQTVTVGKSKAAVQSALNSLKGRQFARRMLGRDPSLWTSDASREKAIRNRLGWLNSIDLFLSKVDEITKFACEVRDAGFQHVVLLGMGGSSLSPDVCRETFASPRGWPQLIMLDNTDPAAVHEVQSRIDLAKTLFIVSSKSGTTGETLSFYSYFYELVKGQLRGDPGNHFVAITDPGTPLVAEGQKRHFRRCFENPENIGGRYSALSYFGLVPMALIGMDIDLLLDRAQQMQYSCGPHVPEPSNPAVHLGTLLGVQHQLGRDKVTFVVSESIRAFAYWVEQLLAESIGKEGFGLVPVEGEPLGTPEVYSNDRVFVCMHANDDTDRDTDEKILALKDADHPVIRIEVSDKMNIGEEFFRWELATATAGSIIGINPFDEPNVAESKENTRELLDEWTKTGQFTEARPILEENSIAIHCDSMQRWFGKIERSSVADFLRSFVRLATPPDYIAFLPYFLKTPERHDILQSMRVKLRDHLKVASTLGYGPRYLHSTGQLHKGGPNSGVFILFTADAMNDVTIPGQQYGFATLQRAQALGDFRSLNSKKRRVIRIHLGPNIEHGLNVVTSSLK